MILSKTFYAQSLKVSELMNRKAEFKTNMKSEPADVDEHFNKLKELRDAAYEGAGVLPRPMQGSASLRQRAR